MVIILYLWYIQNGAPKLLLMAQLLKHPESESGPSNPVYIHLLRACFGLSSISLSNLSVAAEFNKINRFQGMFSFLCRFFIQKKILQAHKNISALSSLNSLFMPWRWTIPSRCSRLLNARPKPATHDDGCQYLRPLASVKTFPRDGRRRLSQQRRCTGK